MGAQAQSIPSNNSKKPIKRRWRNYLLDSRFQLKYTGMVVAITVLVASVLGAIAYDYSKGQTEAMSVTMAFQPDLPEDIAADLEGWAEAEDQKVLTAIVLAIFFFAFALGVTGIMVTHKVVGPAYKLRRLLNEVADGHLRIAGRLRKGDELQDLFEAFANMVEALRDAQAREVTELDAAIEMARETGASQETLASIINVRDRMQKSLD